MTLNETIRMSLHNLWFRKRRTLLNLVGIVTACTLLLMTFAGSRGIANGIESILNTSEDFRIITIRVHGSGWQSLVEPPFGLDAIKGQMSPERRERILEAFQRSWRWLPRKPKPIAKPVRRPRSLSEVAKEVSSYAHVEEALPISVIQCRYELIDTNVPPNPPLHEQLVKAMFDPNEGRSMPMSLVGKTLSQRVVVGVVPNQSDRNGILIHEVSAYRLGFRSDSELEQLVGKTIRLTYRTFADRINTSLVANPQGYSTLKKQVELLTAAQSLIESLDETSLTDSQKELIRNTIQRPEPKAEAAIDVEVVDITGLEPEEVKVATGQEIAVTFDVVVRGVVKTPNAKGLLASVLDRVGISDAGILIHPDLSSELRRRQPSMDSQYRLQIKVDDVANLQATVDQLKREGHHFVNSAVDIIKQAQKQIEQIRHTNSLLALLILGITSLIVFNGMVVSVMERVREFGIMKALGAGSGDVMRLMLCEGAVLGALGGATAVAVSLCLSKVIDYYVRQQVAFQIGEAYEQQVFEFAAMDILLVSAVAIVVCTIASAIPAYRAARLDPVVAMQAR